MGNAPRGQPASAINGTFFSTGSGHLIWRWTMVLAVLLAAGCGTISSRPATAPKNATASISAPHTKSTEWPAEKIAEAHAHFATAVVHEVANEPEYNQIDAVAVMQGVDRRGVLSAYGLDPARAGRGAHIPVLDYGTTHDLQRDLDPRRGGTRDYTGR